MGVVVKAVVGGGVLDVFFQKLCYVCGSGGVDVDGGGGGQWLWCWLWWWWVVMNIRT